MSHTIILLAGTAASIGLFHTLLGPDHYVPFIVMGRARNWSLLKTLWITFLCGLGHVFSSVLLGFSGIALGLLVTKLEIFEGFRGNLAAWAFIAFGFAYFIWGVRQAVLNKSHTHLHTHADGTQHVHTHKHRQEHAHVHPASRKPSLTPWVLFTIFVLGPCEPLIPILMYPAANAGLAGLIFITGVFMATTITTMLAVVTIASLGVNLFPLKRIERYMHAIAGATICICGLSIQFLG